MLLPYTKVELLQVSSVVLNLFRAQLIASGATPDWEYYRIAGISVRQPEAYRGARVWSEIQHIRVIHRFRAQGNLLRRPDRQQAHAPSPISTCRSFWP